MASKCLLTLDWEFTLDLGNSSNVLPAAVSGEKYIFNLNFKTNTNKKSFKSLEKGFIVVVLSVSFLLYTI